MRTGAPRTSVHGLKKMGKAPRKLFPYGQQLLGAPFKPSFGLSGIMALDVPLPFASPPVTCAAYFEESHIKLANGMKLNRKSGGKPYQCFLSTGSRIGN